MVLNTIKLGLGSLFVLLILACSGNKVKEKKQSGTTMLNKNSCNLSLANGRQIVNKLGCRNCHSRNDYGPAPMKNIPLFIKVSAMDSIKLAEYIFKTRHNNMYNKELKDSGKKLDSLNDCERKDMISYIKSYQHIKPKD